MPAFQSVTTAVAHAAIKQASKCIPRHLFRSWHPDSGGRDSKLNSPTHITPHAFKKQVEPASSVFVMQGPELFTNMHDHLTGKRTGESMFSSWFCSLEHALHYVRFARNAHISIIDTKELPSRNNIHWSGSSHFPRDLARMGEEYLAFGIVSGPAYQARPFDHFKGELTRIGSTASSEDLEMSKVTEAIRIGKLFDEKFAVVITAHLLSMNERDVSGNGEIVDRLLQEFNVRPDIVGDNVEETAGLEQEDEVAKASLTFTLTEPRHANALLRALIDRQNDSAHPRSKAGEGTK